MDDFRTGRRPKWRIIVYALIVWAIIFFSSYSQLAEMHQYKYLFWIFIPLPGLFIIYFGFIHEKLKNNKTAKAWMTKHGLLLRWIVFMLLVLNGLWKLHDMTHQNVGAR
jgi:membrane protease YdiL (CAAX protease family)